MIGDAQRIAGAQPTALIAGGSLGGLMAGALLVRQGWSVCILERAVTGLETRGTGIAAHDALFSAFGRAGVRVDDEIGATMEGRSGFSRDGNQTCHFHYPQKLCAWSTLYRRLLAAVPADCYRLGQEVVGVDDSPGGVVVRLGTGERLSADLLIGADGVWSNVRDALCPEQKPAYCGYVGWRGLVDENQVSQRFRERYLPIVAVYKSVGSQFLLSALAGADDSLMPGQRRFGFLWYLAAHERSELPSLLTDVDGGYNGRYIAPPRIQPCHVQRLRDRALATLPSDFADIVQLAPTPFIQPIFDLACEHITFHRTALLGDAAFVVRPHVGAGVTKAACDAVALADALAQEPSISAALQRYASERKPVGVRMVEKARYLGSDLQFRSSAALGGQALSLEEIIREIGRA